MPARLLHLARRRICTAFCAVLISAPAFADAPRRVVSINLCTDQLAMLLAAPGQLISVSHLAQDPRSSVMVDAARAYPANRALAEEVYLMNPDLVLAGSFTARATVSMLQRLGIPVATFPPAASLADVRQGMQEMGAVLGRDRAAAAMLARFDAGLAQMGDADPDHGPTAATYAANGYTPGANSLSGDIIRAAGFRHLATELGLTHGGFLPLEALILAAPDLVVVGETYPGNSRAEEILSHPALTQLRGGRETLEDRDWVCGLPGVVDAVTRMRAARDAIGSAP
ncbi:ABC transporter substrate-binding protein [Pseudotabrizicola alkalilacus]|uniref:ABC transporter substrate-binding protein n=1 Tax=Pseudotabrizicola alkalilacus TaxID=2305252 RepID=A0A411Z6E0_9RHOB|nr:ABC transporter substrate-binding protein [Pseudotabrizicola alkalilacus]RGP38636.1 ABC transporter substrate-binding protein [Pseudotabrizicola alkalilacus]